MSLLVPQELHLGVDLRRMLAAGRVSAAAREITNARGH